MGTVIKPLFPELRSSVVALSKQQAMCLPCGQRASSSPQITEGLQATPTR
jgi:hypothetical protein